MTQFCDWWVDSPHSFGDLVVLWGLRVFSRCLEAEGALGVMVGTRTMAVMVKWSRESITNFITTQQIGGFLPFFSFQLVPGHGVVGLPPIYRGRRSSGGCNDGSMSNSDGWWANSLHCFLWRRCWMGWLVEVFGRVWCRELVSGRWLRLQGCKTAEFPLFVMANGVIELFSCAACLPLIVMWSLDLLVSFHQRFK